MTKNHICTYTREEAELLNKLADAASARLEGNITDGYKYLQNGLEATHKMYFNNPFAIRNVIFNDPATIVFWADGTKTVVKCQEGDWFDPEKGLAMAISKKALGNKGAFNNVFKKWIPQCEGNEEPEVFNFNLTLPDLGQAVENLEKLSEAVKKKMRY